MERLTPCIYDFRLVLSYPRSQKDIMRCRQIWHAKLKVPFLKPRMEREGYNAIIVTSLLYDLFWSHVG